MQTHVDLLNILCPLLYATIQVPKNDVAHSEERKQRSVSGKEGCSNGSASN